MSYDWARWPQEKYTREEVAALPGRVVTTIGGAEVLVSDLCALIRDNFDGTTVRGHLHCALADGNVDDEGLRWEIERAIKGDRYEFAGETHVVEPDATAVLIATLLLLMPERDRFMLDARGFGAGFDYDRDMSEDHKP